MLIIAIILGSLLLNALLAYIPIILIVSYNLRPKPERSLEERYVKDDEISTAQFIELTEREWEDKSHTPLA